jgi:predicted PurR-regulated permease PerM
MTKDSFQAHGLTHTVLALLFMAVLIAASYWVLHLFLAAMVWAAMIVISTWPLMQGVQAFLWGRRSLAVAVMTLLLLMVLLLPLSFASATIVSHTEEIVGWMKSLATFTLPPPPDWVGALPMVGGKIVAQWEHIMVIGPEGISAFLTPYAGAGLKWFASVSGSAGMMVIQFLLTVLIAAIFYQAGDKAAAWLSLFARRIAGHHGEQALILAAGAIRAVALGVVGTALIQSVLAGLGLFVSGVPAAAVLTAVIFLFCLAQLGPGLVLIPAVIWLFWTDQTAWGIAMAVWTLFLGTIDNVIRPLLMKRGSDLPLLLIFAGVIGGLLAFGVIGLFIGPVVLAVTFTLLNAWVVGDETAGEQASSEKVQRDTDPG